MNLLITDSKLRNQWLISLKETAKILREFNTCFESKSYLTLPHKNGL